MDDALASVSIDFGGRSWLVWEADFKREMIGEMPTEMFYHFFKSFADGAKANLNIKAEGINEHHKIEAIFKAFAKAIKMAIKRDEQKMMHPEEVAMRIVSAVKGRKHRLTLTFSGKLTVLLNKFFPKWVDKLVYNHMSKEPDSPF